MPIRKDSQTQTSQSQSTATNTSAAAATVGRILDRKGRDVVAIRPQDTLGDAVRVLKQRGIGALLVTNAQGALQGILSERDIVRKLADAPGRTLPHKVEEVMTAKVQTCTPADSVVSVLKRMSEGRFRHMPVVDETGLVGMVTIGDVVNHRLNELEHEALQLKQLIVG
jgi:CBS domain-containing protein